ncbi:uncharacterized protein LOC110375847 [Helicoverpa armigera]|uniref:Solute carrier family 3 member 2 N-terminal domain-containing protein n=1 Tax=Helicoverpa armigera TaxID=29058 RepID=A0A2W1C2S2_HELAM|nr:uncharacterized protein LOC110375847 [Helicoverpa armigera]XP_047034175.1 uncharacterized protein LOC124640443 [Helicoverpa zea]PZC78443.1 hypothetical protein B5X24_HaOG202187 [Helicoverpa armigera]
MDPERQPLLAYSSEARCRRFGPLTPEEVNTARQEITWRRTRFFLVLMFWALIAMFLSIITCILVSAPRCNSYDAAGDLPSVPPVHMTFAPLIYKMNDDRVYTMQA